MVVNRGHWAKNDRTGKAGVRQQNVPSQWAAIICFQKATRDKSTMFLAVLIFQENPDTYIFMGCLPISESGQVIQCF